MKEIVQPARVGGLPPRLGSSRRSLLRQLWHGRSPNAPIPEVSTAVAVRRRDARYRRTLAAADVIAFLGAAFVALDVAGDGHLSVGTVACAPLVVLANKIAGLYDRDEHVLHKTTLDETPGVLQVTTLFALGLYLGQGVLTGAGVTRGEAAVLWPLLFVFALTGRAAARWLARRRVEPERCLVVGDPVSGERLRRKFESTHSLLAEVVGMVPAWTSREPGEPGVPMDPSKANGTPPQVLVLGQMETLGLVLVEHDIHRVIFVPRTSDSDQILDVIRVVKALGVKVSVLPDLFEVVGSSVEVDDVGGLPLMGLRRRSLTRSSAFLKRAMDATVAAAAMFLLGPLLALVALAIKLDSRGPVLFRQRRIGQHGDEFDLYKFRTMVDGADDMKPELMALNEAEGLFKIRSDPRITRVGRLLRRTHLDELPQLFNVLRGEMSLVGPRPLVPDEDKTIEGWHRLRVQLLPGMTGHWQILGGPRVPLHEMVKIDHLYVANWSLWLDLKILLRTVPHVLARRGE
ncbi:MAG: exopolysaccharide biosynthesis polyprenyl glycosylphosphotransferase [Gaiellaceae bacterium]